MSEENLKELVLYTHHAPKTTLENWMINNISGFIEKLFPENWTPNVITLIGNSALPITLCFFLSNVGMKLTAEEPFESHYLIYAALAVFWFSQFDIMDGVRARRQKSGSPIGRIIDEALDMVQQASWALLCGYMFRFDNLLFEFLMVMTNTVQHTMEMRFLMFGSLSLTVGDFGPVELESLI